MIWREAERAHEEPPRAPQAALRMLVRHEEARVVAERGHVSAERGHVSHQHGGVVSSILLQARTQADRGDSEEVRCEEGRVSE